MGFAAGRSEADAERALRARGQEVVGRLAVDEEAAVACPRVRVGGARAVARHLFVNREEQSDLFYTFGAQSLGGRDLRGDDALRVARAAARDEFVVLARSDVRRHGVHVRREYDASPRAADAREYVRAALCDLLRLDFVAESFEMTGEEAADSALFARHRRDVDQPPRQIEKLCFVRDHVRV